MRCCHGPDKFNEAISLFMPHLTSTHSVGSPVMAAVVPVAPVDSQVTPFSSRMGPRPQRCPQHTAAPLALSKKILQEVPPHNEGEGEGAHHNEALPLTKRWWGSSGGGLKQQSVQDSQCDRLESCRRLGWGFNPQASGPSYLTAGNLTRRAGRVGVRGGDGWGWGWGWSGRLRGVQVWKTKAAQRAQPRLHSGVCWTSLEKQRASNNGS